MKKMTNMRLRRALLLAVALVLVLNLSGCSWFRKKTPVDMTTAGPTTDLTVPQPPDVSAPESLPGAELRRPEILEAPVDFPPTAGVSDIGFEYDKADIRDDQRAILDRNLEYFRDNPGDKIMIEGHCDERGTTEYNIALGQRRAAAVQDYLMRGGIAAERLATISRGKEQPLDPGHNEEAWARNRRAHFLRFK